MWDLSSEAYVVYTAVPRGFEAEGERGRAQILLWSSAPVARTLSRYVAAQAYVHTLPAATAPTAPMGPHASSTSTYDLVSTHRWISSTMSWQVKEAISPQPRPCCSTQLERRGHGKTVAGVTGPTTPLSRGKRRSGNAQARYRDERASHNKGSGQRTALSYASTGAYRSDLERRQGGVSK